MEQEQASRTMLAYETGAFAGLAHHGKLKPYGHYTQATGKQSPREMLSMLKGMGANSNMKITRVKRQAVNDRG